MKTLLVSAGILSMAWAMAACSSPGATTGAAAGAVGGALVAGPPGAVVGGAAGAIAGTIADANAPRFRTYVIAQHKPSYTYSGDIVVGAALPEEGVVLYEVPSGYDVATNRYTVVNDKVVLVDPTTHRIVQVLG